MLNSVKKRCDSGFAGFYSLWLGMPANGRSSKPRHKRRAAWGRGFARGEGWRYGTDYYFSTLCLMCAFNLAVADNVLRVDRSEVVQDNSGQIH